MKLSNLQEKLTKKEARKRRSELVAERGKLLNPLKKKIRFAENEIEQHEERLNALNQEMMEASGTGNGGQIADISKKIHTCNDAIEKRFADLEALHEKKDKLEKKFGELLKDRRLRVAERCANYCKNKTRYPRKVAGDANYPDSKTEMESLA